MADTPADAATLPPRKNPFGWVLVVLGGVAILVGIIAALVAKSAERASSFMPTLAVSQHSAYHFPVAPDYTGVWIGFAAAAVGALFILVGALAVYRGRKAF